MAEASNISSARLLASFFHILIHIASSVSKG